MPLMAGLDKELLMKFQKEIKREGNHDRDLVKVFNYCLKHHPNYQTPLFFQKNAGEKIFKSAFNYTRLMRGFSNVFKRLTQFLIEQEFNKNSFIKDYLLATAYKNYGLDVPLQRLINKKIAKEDLVEKTGECLEQLQWAHLAYFSGKDSKLIQDNEILINTNNMLDNYFVGIKLRYLCELANRASFLGESYMDEFEILIVNYCEKSKGALSITNWLYYQTLLLIKNKDGVIFYKLKKKYGESWCTLIKDDQIILLTYLINFTSAMIRRNEEVFIKEQYLLYQFGIDKEIMMINQRFIGDQYINLIYISSYLKEFDWIAQFKDKWNKQLKNWLPDSAYNLAEARLHFAQGLFEECQKELQKIDYSNYGHFFRAKMLEIACAYELDEPNKRMEPLCKSLENYFRRKENIHHQNSIGGLNFIRCIRQLKKHEPNKKLLEKIMLEAEYIVFQKWLKEKIAAIK